MPLKDSKKRLSTLNPNPPPQTLATPTPVPPTLGLSQGIQNLAVQNPVTPPRKEQHLSTTHASGDHKSGLEEAGIMMHPRFRLAISANKYSPIREQVDGTPGRTHNLDLEISNLSARTSRARSATATSDALEERDSIEQDARQQVIDERENAVTHLDNMAKKFNSHRFPRPTPRRSSRAPKGTPAYRQGANALDSIMDDEDQEEGPDTRDQLASILTDTCPYVDSNSLLITIVKKAYPIKTQVTDPERLSVIKE
ncbi:hypothetical protein DDE83_009117 [Stemphylium lycopersici]|uniref:Uncharacterized protein n=1 Tax=Stemphylium lycopersici TaxID=183478 RepID=A0A364MRH6_STELY|nr:hypothetical protein DDE83_009117 [Stemphylium lycopersici]